MNTVTRMSLALSLAALVMGSSVACAANGSWVLVDEDPMISDYYYDKASVAPGEEGLVKVMTKAVYTAEGKADALDTIGHPKGFEDLTATGFLYTVNCPGEMSRLEKVTHFDSKGGAIRAYDLAGKTKWEVIEPDTRMSLLRDAVCK